MNETAELVTKEYLKGELQELRGDLRVDMQQLRTELQKFRGDLLEQLRADQRWTVGLIIGVYATNIATLLAILAILFKSH